MDGAFSASQAPRAKEMKAQTDRTDANNISANINIT